METQSPRRALITGVSGQDGAYLAQLLIAKGYHVYGTVRRVSSPNLWRLQHLGILRDVRLIPAEMTDMSALMQAVHLSEPDEIYNLAAQSFVGASFESPLSTGMVDGLAPIQLLEVIRLHRPQARFYQASTSELYGNSEVPGSRLSETTTFRPNSPYAAAKLLAYHSTRIYREAYGLFAVSGILFNHESPLRGLEFVTRKISNAVARISLGLQDSLYLGNLGASRDWGYAPEYVEAMWLMLQQPQPQDYVIATGKSYTVEAFCKAAFERVGLDWSKYVKDDRRFRRPLEVNALLGDPSKAQRELGWNAQTTYEELVKLMVDADLDRWKRQRAGEVFAWDAPNFPDGGELRYMNRGLKV
jgi:GDPmannose 4,6-dehydratase